MTGRDAGDLDITLSFHPDRYWHIRAFVEHQRLGALPLDAVGGVAEDEHCYPMAFAQADGQIHHRVFGFT